MPCEPVIDAQEWIAADSAKAHAAGEPRPEVDPEDAARAAIFDAQTADLEAGRDGALSLEETADRLTKAARGKEGGMCAETWLLGFLAFALGVAITLAGVYTSSAFYPMLLAVIVAAAMLGSLS